VGFFGLSLEIDDFFTTFAELLLPLLLWPL
jgi:hypothetical protein